MSRTKRAYNYPNSPISEWHHDLGWKPFWHPYKRIWNNKHFEYKYYDLMSKRRRNQYGLEIKRELINLCPYNSLAGKNECFNCLNTWYGEDNSCVNEIPVLS
jgi:hypothetical protein